MGVCWCGKDGVLVNKLSLLADQEQKDHRFILHSQTAVACLHYLQVNLPIFARGLYILKGKYESISFF